MDFLVRFVHIHESFRIPELKALAALHGLDLDIIFYEKNSPFCIIRLPCEEAARTLLSRSILAYSIYELWATAFDHATLRSKVAEKRSLNRSQYKTQSFRFAIDSFQAKHTPAEQRKLIESFDFLGFEGPIKMENAELEFCIFEDYDLHAPEPRLLYFGRFIANSGRGVVLKYDLKKRAYISRTSMDAELSLVTANLILANSGKLVYDPFVGTGSFTVACAHYGAAAFGSDIDGRSIRGTPNRNQLTNFKQYDLENNFIDNFICDITNSPLRVARILDAIVCDPPYGVREGPKVLGARVEGKSEMVMIDGQPAHLREGYIPPKKPYAFNNMLQDILNLSALMLVDHGRLAMWMPTADDVDIELAIPKHSALELVDVCVQAFNKWSRRLLIYRRLNDESITEPWPSHSQSQTIGLHADDVNDFRKKYFQGFRAAPGGI